MKLAAFGLGLLGAVGAVVSSVQTRRPTTIIITGDFAGYLQPCGCTKPQRGGLTRQASLIHQLQRTQDVVLLSNGALSGGTNPQDILKVETISQALGALGVTAINLAPEDARLGLGMLESIQNLSGGKLISGSIGPGSVSIEATASLGTILVGGISFQPAGVAHPIGRTAISADGAVARLLTEAKLQSMVPVLLLDGTLDEATAIAMKFAELRLIVYRSTSDSPIAPQVVGKTMLVTPGELGKSVVRLTFDGDAFGEYEVIRLDPNFPNDPQIDRFYRSYINMVDKKGFIDQIQRQKSAPFGGTKTCGSCHAIDLKIWQHTKHAGGLATLERIGQQRDPECALCHVVGLKAKGGFVSRQATPDLANVGCESCHGPGARHSRAPRIDRMPKVGTTMCARCHTPDQSPNFNALTEWTTIQHR